MEKKYSQKQLASFARIVYRYRKDKDVYNKASDALKEYFAEHGAFDAGGYHISVTTFDKRSLDTSAIKAEKPEIYNAYARVISSNRLNVK